MTSQSRRQNNPVDDSKTEAEKILEMMYMQGKAQFGDAMKSFWVYNGDLCPGCLARPNDGVKFKGKDALSINGFIYRPRGVLIGYFLCDTCANYILSEAVKNPYKETPLHADIERNLAETYLRYLSWLDA